jgi:hypothetical protein
MIGSAITRLSIRCRPILRGLPPSTDTDMCSTGARGQAAAEHGFDTLLWHLF